MLPKPSACKGCVLENLGQGFATTDGKGRLGVLVVAEALGADEAEMGRPLVGPAGQLFNRIVTRTPDEILGRNFERDDFLLANVINCRPPNNLLADEPYEYGAIAHCSPYLKDLIAKFNPKVILAMGNTPLRWLTGNTGINGWRGYVVESPYGLVVPTFHPSYLQRGNMKLVRVFIHDLKKAVQVAREGYTRKPTKYLLRPSPEEAVGWANEYFRALEVDPSLPLGCDIETPYSGNLDEDSVVEDDDSYIIERISFAYRECEAITFPWTPPYTDIARRLLATPSPKLVWNMAFDVPRCDYNDAPWNGRIYDLMHAWHMFQPEWPMGLKFAATFGTDLPQWKSKSFAEPELYSAVDSDALPRLNKYIRGGMEKKGQWEAFERHVVDLAMVLRKMSKRGLLVSREKRAIEKARFQERYEEVVKELTSIVPPSILPRHPKKGYKKTEEQLRKAGIWQEGKMVSVGVMSVKVKEPKPPKVKNFKPTTPSKRGCKQPQQLDTTTLAESQIDLITLKEK